MKDEKGLTFIRSVRNTFPDAASKADTSMMSRGYDRNELDDMFTTWLSNFADITGQLMTEEKKEEVISHFLYFVKQYKDGDNDIKSLIDVDYVENLFWKVPKEVCNEYWGYLPKLLQELYISFHHKPPL
jgi:hypothetical protein